MKVVVFHRNCTDGTCAMQVVRKAIGTEDVTFVAAQYNEPMPEVLTFKNPRLAEVEVIVVDFSFPREALLFLSASCKSLLVLDHHIGAKDALFGIEGCYFDNDRSGAMMAWNHFFPGQFPPLVVQYVQDWDLWRKELEYCDEFCAAVKHRMNDQQFWDDALQGFSHHDLLAHLDIGHTIVAIMNEQVQKSVRSAVYTDLLGFRTSLVNVTQHISEVGHAICHQMEVDFSTTYFIKADGQAVLSFRAKKGGVDVSKIAQQFGGNGHVSAAGAVVSMEYLSGLYAASKQLDKPVEEKPVTPTPIVEKLCEVRRVDFGGVYVREVLESGHLSETLIEIPYPITEQDAVDWREGERFLFRFEGQSVTGFVKAP